MSFPKRQHLKRIPVWIPQDRPVTYFVTLCCAQRQRIFVQNQSVQIGAECLLRTETRFTWKVHHVCFMPDHVHLLLSPVLDRDQNLSAFIQAWKSCVALRLRHCGHTGAIWQREFFDRLLRSDEKLEEKWAYVRENPVRTGLCKSPEEYPYLGSPQEVLERLT